MKPPSLSLPQLRQLGDPIYQVTARPDWTDRNNHVNIRYFVVIFDDAGDRFYTTAGLSDADHLRRASGTMDLEHHVHFVREIRVGDSLTVYLRILAVTEKRFHYLMFLQNETNGQLASIFECVNTFVDLSVRRSAPWPADVRAALEALRDSHAAVDWPAPVCGSMSA